MLKIGCLIIVMKILVITSACSTERFSMNQLVHTGEWCPNFVSDLRLQNNAGIFGNDIFYGDYLILDRVGQIRFLNLHDREISRIEGINYFSSLEFLRVDSTELVEVDLSNNVVLVRLEIWASQLAELDISRNYMLRVLHIWNSNLTQIDISNNQELAGLYILNSRMTTLDLTHNSSLRWLEVRGNHLTGLDVSNNHLLDWLNVSFNNIYSLDDVVGWEAIGLELLPENEIDGGNFVFFPQS